MKKIFILTISVFLSFIINAQDVHFTQHFASPLTLNPALAGNFNGNYRATAIYRDQWRGVVNPGFISVGTSFDMRVKLFKRSRYADAMGVGMNFYTDRLSSSGYTANQINLSGAYHKSLNPHGNNYLSIGFYGGIAQRDANFDDISFGDQFNGVNGYTNPTSEELPDNNYTFADFGAGVFWSYSPSNTSYFYFGGTIHHANRPNISFDQEQNIPILPRFTGHLGGEIPFSRNLAIVPGINVSSQGSHLRLNSGLNVKMMLETNALYLGAWVRPVSGLDNGIAIDAAMFVAAFDFSTARVGVSYDLNLSQLSGGTGHGAFEISMAYIGQYEDDNVSCPRF